VSLLLLLVGAWLAGLGGQSMIDPVFCTGCEAVVQNPAALVLPGGPPASLNWFGARLRLASNGFTLGDYGRYLARPTFLTDQDEQNILNEIGTGPLELEASTDIEILHAQYKWLGAGIDYQWVLAQSLPRNLFEIAFRGNELNRAYDLNGFATDSLALLRATAAGGLPVGERAGIGIGLSWLHGFNYVLTTASAGELKTTPYAISGYMTETRTQADGGDGFAVSLGGALRLNESWQLGASLRDLPSRIWWHGNPGVRQLGAELESLSASRYRIKPSLDSFLLRTSTFSPGPGFTTSLPGVAALGAGFAPSEVVRVAAVMNLRLWADAFLPEPPLAAARVDVRPLRSVQVSVMPGWHMHKGPGGHAAVGFQIRGIIVALDTEVWGLPSVSTALFRLRLGYDF